MTAKEYLESYREYAAIEAEKLAAFKEAEERLKNIPSSLGHVDEPHNRHAHGSIEDRIIDLQTKREAWAVAALNALEVRQEVFGMVYDIEGVAGDVVIERYLNLKTWRQICEVTGKAENTVYRAHKEGLRILQERIDKNVVMAW